MLAAQLRKFRVEVLLKGQWRFWKTLRALDRSHAETLVYETDKLPVSKFRITR